ncbi:hypothetical protein [Aulosira sp. FACHB-615]|uniref:hypothetical protein n=1 Tax=Aulosira sp. FACHB-615 TaxID=2692777 RepID=UPI0016879E29|nr:hypothetical protein [Aulosira sp. FACHB-615]MBD2491356.1 hypothetical protein [Aulosira sp. FACHB-615]
MQSSAEILNLACITGVKGNPCTSQFRLNGEMRAHGQVVLGECTGGDRVLVGNLT